MLSIPKNNDFRICLLGYQPITEELIITNAYSFEFILNIEDIYLITIGNNNVCAIHIFMGDKQFNAISIHVNKIDLSLN